MNRTQTILLGVIAACLIILVVVFVALPVYQEQQRQNMADTFDEVSRGLELGAYCQEHPARAECQTGYTGPFPLDE